MRRLIVVVAFVIALLAPSPADAQVPEYGPWFPVGPFAECQTGQSYPYTEATGNPTRLYLSSNFVVNCRPTNSVLYSIDRYHVEFRHGVLVNGTWGVYSDEASVRDYTGPGLVGFLPSRDKCDWGGPVYRYRGRWEITVTARSNFPGGMARNDTKTGALAGPGSGPDLRCNIFEVD